MRGDVGGCGELWGVIRKTTPRVMRKRETCFQMPLNLVFNIILRYFQYDITPYSDDNVCYRRS